MFLLSSTYFGPIQWYQKLFRGDCEIEQYDHFMKQTYRNRCLIATTEGIQALTVPVEKPDGGRLDKTLMRDVRISDHGNWQHLHWNALQSAYGESPFFEYYADDLRPFFERRWEFLYDFNWTIMEKMCELLDFDPHVRRTEDYAVAGDFTDLREVIRPKHPGNDPSFAPRRYYQVYQQKFGFQPNLSILDLLFNEGNEAVYYLASPPTPPRKGGE
ncbi:MAG: WbqC family protein [Prevotellaceae bacterium]|nr:WbqC family protein [Prevotella sp.]MDD6553670.1 WbqC family protein [Prevotellaceae bacterium]